jgi:hypothetical protein
LTDFLTTPKNYLGDKSAEEKTAYLEATSYRDYLRCDAGLGDEAVKYFESQTNDFFCPRQRRGPGLRRFDYGFLGFEGLGLEAEEAEEQAVPYIYHFPDGNVSIARLLGRPVAGIWAVACLWRSAPSSTNIPPGLPGGGAACRDRESETLRNICVSFEEPIT